MSHDILVVDDEADIRELVSGILADEGYYVRAAADSESALASIAARRPSLLVLDIWMQDSRQDGLELLDTVHADDPDLPVLMISGHGNIEVAVSAIKRGAYDFIEKPFKADHLLVMVQHAIEAVRLKRENRELRMRTGDDGRLIGDSPSIHAVRQLVEKVAPTGSRVLIMGPAGSGKEVVARLLHGRSRRTESPFVVLNAASMAPEHMERELFGVEGEGGGRKIGVFEQAHGGTLFIDEVCDMPVATQAKILRVLVDQTFERVGGNTIVQVDVRVVSATSKDLRQEIAKGNFREDLYHRLNVVPIHVPPLVDRREDIPDLIEHFMTRLAAATGVTRRKIGSDVLAALQSHNWPGNVRQLHNIVERLLILSSGEGVDEIGIELLPSEVLPTGNGDAGGNGTEKVMGLSLRQARESFEREYLIAQIVRFGGNISRTASFVRMERSALHRKLKSLNISQADWT